MNVSFLGLGRMGQAMARNLLNANVDLTVWNRSRSEAEDLVRSGASRAETVADASDAEIAITMLADDAALDAVAFEGGLVERLPRGSIHVAMSTTSVALSERLTEAHAERGGTYVAAPVFGRPDVAAAARLFIVAAGPAVALDRCQPIFDAMGQRTFRFGERPAAANLIKLSGNVLIAAVIESLAEAIALVRKYGVDPHQYVDLLTNTLFSAPIYKTYGGLIADARYEPAAFTVPLGLKDVSLALDAASASHVPLPIASLVRDHLLTLLAQGKDHADWCALGALAAQNAGLTRA